MCYLFFFCLLNKGNEGDALTVREHSQPTLDGKSANGRAYCKVQTHPLLLHTPLRKPTYDTDWATKIPQNSLFKLELELCSGSFYFEQEICVVTVVRVTKFLSGCRLPVANHFFSFYYPKHFLYIYHLFIISIYSINFLFVVLLEDRKLLPCHSHSSIISMRMA